MVAFDYNEVNREYTVKEIKVMIWPLLVGIVNSLIGKYKILYAIITVLTFVVLNILRLRWKKTNLTFDNAVFDGSAVISVSLLLLLSSIRILGYYNCGFISIILSLFIYILWNYLAYKLVMKEMKGEAPLLSALGGVSFSGFGTVMLIKAIFGNASRDVQLLIPAIGFFLLACSICWGYIEIIIQVKKKKQREQSQEQEQTK